MLSTVINVMNFDYWGYLLQVFLDTSPNLGHEAMHESKKIGGWGEEESMLILFQFTVHCVYAFPGPYWKQKLLHNAVQNWINALLIY